MINIIDFGVSNVASVANMVKKVGGTPNIISDHSELNTIKSNKAILPGVGSFDSAMKMLNRGNWFNSLNQYIENSSNSILGICLGMQIMFNRSEEGQLEGLKWIDGDIRKFQFEDKKLKVPHMGWNFISPKKMMYFFNQALKGKDFILFIHFLRAVMIKMIFYLSLIMGLTLFLLFKKIIYMVFNFILRRAIVMVCIL